MPLSSCSPIKCDARSISGRELKGRAPAFADRDYDKYRRASGAQHQSLLVYLPHGAGLGT